MNSARAGTLVLHDRITLDSALRARAHESLGREIATTISAIAKATTELRTIVSQGRLGGDLSALNGSGAVGGDPQKQLDRIANDKLIEALRDTPVAFVASEETDEPLILDKRRPLAVAIDPLDGSSNIDTNVSIGTIFSVLRVPSRDISNPVGAFLQPGSAQVAAGFVIYGPQTVLVLAFGSVDVFIFDEATEQFVRALHSPTISRDASEYAINASNYRHWPTPIQNYIDDCIRGADGPLSKNFNMRWIASLVAEAYRILVRGGVFLYPEDKRKGYEAGRLRLIYEANPIAFIIEHAGGAATDGTHRVLELQPTFVHQRTPMIFGSAHEVTRIASYHGSGGFSRHAPLFSPTALLRT